MIAGFAFGVLTVLASTLSAYLLYRVSSDVQNDANREIAHANERANLAAKAAEEERIERLRLEAEIAPRRLSRKQQEVIALALGRFRVCTVIVTSYAQDAESAVLAKQIIEALALAGLKPIDGTASLMQMGGFSMGIHVSGNNLQLKDAIKDSLSRVGQLAVASESPMHQVPNPVGIVSGVTHATKIDASILVGIKPVTR